MRTPIRRAIPADIPAVVDLMREFYAESNNLLEREWAAASFARLLQSEERGAVWIATRGLDLAGHAVLVLKHSMEFGGPAGIIDDLFVRPAFRRQGVGRALVTELVASSRAKNVAAIDVEVGPDNIAALALYRSFGLHPHDPPRQALTVQLAASAA